MNQLTLFDYGSLDAETSGFLRESAQRINERSRKIALNIWENGRDFAKAQEKLARPGRYDGGTFVQWAEQETGYSKRTVYNFISVYQNLNFANFANLEIATSALYALAAPSTPEEARQEAIDRAEIGERITYTKAREIVQVHRPEPIVIRDITPTKALPKEILESIPELADQAAEEGRGYTEEEWSEQPESYRGHCWKSCYSGQSMVKGSVWEYGVRGVYVCASCGYAYPPFSNPGPEQHDDEPDGSRMAVHFSSGTDEHYTPQEIIDVVLELMGAIDLDPCSNSKEQPNVPATHHYTVEDDGLTQEWQGRVYMNPPYGRVIEQWVEKLCAEHEAGHVTEAVALVPARTDTQWWAQLRDYAVCLVEGRLKFTGDNSAPFPSAVFYLGNHIDRFYHSFCHLGDIWQRIEPGMFGE